jgi:hypothetical protein
VKACIDQGLRTSLMTVGLLIALSLFSPHATAFTEPGFTGAMTDFANCPVNVIEPLAPETSTCVHSYTTGGAVQIGHSVVPISVPGNTFDLGVNGVTVAPPHGLLNGPAQPIPAGLLGSVGSVQLTGVSAKLEWAAPISPGSSFGLAEGCAGTNPRVTFDICRILRSESGTAITLSVKLHLLSPFLGSTCYIGSVAKPIVISLTTGVTSPPPPTQPIHGKPAEFIFEPTTFYQQAVGLRLVNNSFAVPAATGCGTSVGSLVNASVNHKLGLPSPPGQNMIAINANAEQVPARTVLAAGWPYE